MSQWLPEPGPGPARPRRSLASRLLRYAPTIRRAHRTYATDDATRAAMSQLLDAPAGYAPPRWMPRGVTVTPRRGSARWPVYEVVPERRSPGADILFLHGGAYFRELKPQHWRFAVRLAAGVGARVVVPIYPLAPAATADAVVPGVVEIAAALLTDQPARPVFLAGDSAGGGMALAVAQELQELQELRELLPPSSRQPTAMVLVSPWVDISCSDPHMAELAARDPWLQAPGLAAAGRAYRGSRDVDHPWVSPIHGPLAGLPEMLVLSGTDDILNVDAHRLVDAVTRAGGVAQLVEAMGQIHDYPLHPTPEGKRARREIVRWLSSRAGAGGRGAGQAMLDT